MGIFGGWSLLLICEAPPDLDEGLMFMYIKG